MAKQKNTTPMESQPGPTEPQPDPTGYHILRLFGENIKCLKAIEIDAQGKPVIIGGDNGQGKSSALDIVAYALGGKALVDAEPVRRGNLKAHAGVDCGEFIAKRIFRKGAQKLELHRKDGQPIERPQEWLDQIIGKLSFDPRAFIDMANKDRIQMLLDLTGLESELESITDERNKLYEQRTEKHHEQRTLAGQLEKLTAPESDWPTERIIIADLIREKNERNEIIKGFEKKRETLAGMRKDDENRAELIHQMEMELAELRTTHEKNLIETNKFSEYVEKLVDPDINEIDDQINAAEDNNACVDARKKWDETVAEKAEIDAQVSELNDSIKALDDQKKMLLENADLPIDGLVFTEDMIMYNGILFDQLADSEKTRVSMALAMAVNPKLKVVLIKTGALLDDKSIQIVLDMAKQNDYQPWIEVVGKRAGATVIIEGGEIKTDG